jgi:hypothetical protein
MISKKFREATSLQATLGITEGRNSWGLKKFGAGKFRSKYENAFAVYLNELGIKWQFEKFGEPITNETDTKLHYIPDFYLPDYGVYIEITNGMSKRLSHKMYTFTEQNKFGKLFVLDVQHLRDMFDSKFTIYDVIGHPKKKKIITT